MSRLKPRPTNPAIPENTGNSRKSLQVLNNAFRPNQTIWNPDDTLRPRQAKLNCCGSSTHSADFFLGDAARVGICREHIADG